jgi:tetratricopeptide (TPR) repeat protein
MIALRAGRIDLAEAELTAALAAEPSSPSARWAMGCVESAAGRHEAALEIFEQLLREDNYYREAYHSALSECVFLERFKKGARISERAARLFPRSAALLACRGYFLSRAGCCRRAIAAYEKATAIEPLQFIFVRDLRLLYVKEGMYEKAIDLWKVSFGKQIIRKENRLLPLWRQFEDAARRAAGGREPAQRRELVRALTAMGWWAEAAAIDGTHALSGLPGSLLSNAAEGEKLVTLLGRYGKSLGAEIAQRKRRVSFSSAVAELESATRSSFGRPLVLPGAIRSAPGVRWFADSPGHPQPLLDIVRGGNMEIILFENVFERKINFEFGELLCCELRRRPGEGFGYWSATCCPSGYGLMDGESGLAYPPFTGYAIFYDAAQWTGLCDVRRRQRRNPLEHSWFLEEVSGRRVRPKAVSYSRMLEKRLFEKVCRGIEHGQGEAIQGSIENLYAAVVAEHEYQHLLDLRRHLPVWEHPVSCLLLALRNLFRPSMIEACFEERAIFRSLACCSEPLLALLAVHAQLKGGEDPHSVASRRALSRIIDCVAAHPEEFPSIDCGRNILNQLYRLSGEQVRGIARKVRTRASVLRDG